MIKRILISISLATSLFATQVTPIQTNPIQGNINIEKMVENRGMEDIIQEIIVPTEEKIEIKNGKKKTKQKKIFPGYVVVKMIMTDESWYVVRNTRGVTGFVGPGSKPIPLSEKEIKSMGIEEPTPEIDIRIGDTVKVTSGPFENFMGVVKGISLEKQTLRVLISMFGRETPIEIHFTQIEKL